MTMQVRRCYEVDINLSAAQLETYYAGAVRFVWARTRQGQSIQFPLVHLRRFVSHTGVQGRFRLQVVNQQLECIDRISIL